MFRNFKCVIYFALRSFSNHNIFFRSFQELSKPQYHYLVSAPNSPTLQRFPNSYRDRTDFKSLEHGNTLRKDFREPELALHRLGLLEMEAGKRMPATSSTGKGREDS